MKNTEIFSDLSSREIEKIASLGRLRSLTKGDTLFKEGDKGDHFYVVVDGTIAVNKNVAGGRKRNLSNLVKGDVLGELALFDAEPRSADAEAIDGGKVMEFANEGFLKQLNDNPSIAVSIQSRIIGILCKRLRDTSNMLKDGVIWGFSMES